MSATRFVQRPAAPAAAPSRDPLLGKSIGQCYLQRKLGEGGMATVYLARHVSLGRFVAVKVMTRGLPRDFRARERFMKEAQAAARLDHPNIVAVHDGGKEEGIDYLVMQYVEGESLGARLRRGERLTLAETVRIARGALAGLAHAHANGIIHRDVKPDNILLGRDGSVKLADFGLARLLEADCNLSLTGSNIIGTPHYMSPEQALTGKVDCRTDLYSVGATLFHMLTGVPPFVAPSSVGVLQKVVQEPLRPPRAVRSGVPAAFSEYVCLLMRKEPAKRIATASEALALLDRLVAAERRRPRRSRRVLRAAAVLVVSAVVVLLAAGTPLGTLARKALPGAEASARPGGGSQAPAAPLTRAEEKALRARLADLKRAARSGEPLRLLAFVDDTSRISVRRTFRGGGSVPQRREALFRRFLDEVQGLDPRAASVEARDALDGARAAVVAYPLPGEGGQRRLSWVERDGVWLLVPPGRQPSHGG